MKLHVALLITIAFAAGTSGKKSSSSGGMAPSGPSPNGYSQPIASPYAAIPPSPASPYPYGSQQMAMAGSSPTADYYQPIDSQGYGGNYGGYPAPSSPGYAPRGAPGAYEPVPQGSSGHHHHHHPMKPRHGWGGHGHNELTTVLYIALPLIILPLLLLWPYFLLTPHHNHPVVYAAGWKRSADGKAPVVSSAEEAKNKKTDELSEKILPKLEKAGKNA